MGSNILIESSYLDSNQQSFQALVSNIRGIVDKLNFNLDNMDNSIKEAKNVLKKVILLISNTQNT
jgi:predicted PurR-regulated permease PerM